MKADGVCGMMIKIAILEFIESNVVHKNLV